MVWVVPIAATTTARCVIARTTRRSGSPVRPLPSLVAQGRLKANFIVLMRCIRNSSDMEEFDLAHLTAFQQVVETGSFSAAAARLNLSQPAVSLRVRQLERRLGVRLLERSG